MNDGRTLFAYIAGNAVNIRECAKCWNSLNEIWVAFADRTEATSTEIYSLFLGSSSNRNIVPIYSSFSFYLKL